MHLPHLFSSHSLMIASHVACVAIFWMARQTSLSSSYTTGICPGKVAINLMGATIASFPSFLSLGVIDNSVTHKHKHKQKGRAGVYQGHPSRQQRH